MLVLDIGEESHPLPSAERTGSGQFIQSLSVEEGLLEGAMTGLGFGVSRSDKGFLKEGFLKGY